MRASRNDRRPASAQAAAPSRHVEAFLEMLAAERGAARLTLAAYRNDLADLAGFLAAARHRARSAPTRRRCMLTSLR